MATEKSSCIYQCLEIELILTGDNSNSRSTINNNNSNKGNEGNHSDDSNDNENFSFCLSQNPKRPPTLFLGRVSRADSDGRPRVLEVPRWFSIGKCKA